MEWPVEELTSHFRENALKARLLKPSWVVFTDYLILGMLIVSSLSIGVKLTYDDLVCTPMACPSNFTSGRSLTQCNPSHLMVLEREHMYGYIEKLCADEVITWYTDFFPYIMVTVSLLIYFCSNLWVTIPFSAIRIENFVGIVNECNEAVGTFSYIYRILLGNPDYNPENNRDKERFSPISLTEQYSQDFDKSSSPEEISVLALHEKAEKIGKDLTSTSGLQIICRAQSVLQTFLAIAFFVVMQLLTFVFPVHNTSYDCVLEMYSSVNIVCNYDAGIYHRILLYLFIILCLPCISLSVFHLCWVIYHMKLKFELTFINAHKEEKKTDETGDFAFLLWHLYSYDEKYISRFSLFYNKSVREKANEFAKESMFSVKDFQKMNDSRKLLNFQNESYIPRKIMYVENLADIRIVDCELTEIPLFLFSITTLQALDVSNNQINKIIKFPGNNTNTKRNTFWKQRQEKFSPKLEILVLEDNKLDDSSLENLETWQKLTFLGLYGNNFSNLINLSRGKHTSVDDISAVLEKPGPSSVPPPVPLPDNIIRIEVEPGSTKPKKDSENTNTNRDRVCLTDRGNFIDHRGK